VKTKLLMAALAAATITAPVPALSQESAVYSTFEACEVARAEVRRTLSAGMRGLVLGRFNKLYNATYQCKQTAGADTEDPSDDAFSIVEQ
jgi:hypothetical protein